MRKLLFALVVIGILGMSGCGDVSPQYTIVQCKDSGMDGSPDKDFVVLLDQKNGNTWKLYNGIWHKLVRF